MKQSHHSSFRTKSEFTSAALLGASALGLLLAGTPTRADDLQVLKQQIEAMQKKIEQLEKSQTTQERTQQEIKTKVEAGAVSPASVVTAGDFKGSYKLPGTDTSFSVYGFVKGDAIISSRSAGGQNAIGDQFLLPSAIPVGPGAGGNERKQTTLHARQSRLGLRTSTPNTPWGLVTTLLELDLFGASNAGGPALANSSGDELVSGRNAPSLRHAYATIGNFGIGQFWTAFENPAAIPDTLDFGGPVGNIFIRQSQLRWTQPFSGGSWEISLENPESAIANAAGTVLRPDDDRYPDIVGRVNLLKTSKGDFWGSILARNIRIDVPAAGAVPAIVDGKWGAAIQLGGVVPFKTSVGADDLRFAVNFGDVIGRYQELGFFVDGVLVNNRIELPKVVSGFAAYRHFWSPRLRSTLVLSGSRASLPTGAAGTLNKAAQSAHLNLIWNPYAAVDLGVEYIYGRREIQSGLSGSLNRLQFSAKHNF